MACSDTKIYTTWSNLKHSAISKRISRHPSGNNNTSCFLQQSSNGAIVNAGGTVNTNDLTINNGPKTRSQSLPDLKKIVTVQRSDAPPLNFSVSILCIVID